MQMAIIAFRKAAPGNQKVIVLISGEHDHGSVGSDAGSLIREVSSSNASVYSLSFRPGKTEIFGKLRSFNPLAMTGGAMQRNAPEALAQLTGGDFFRYNSERDFEDRIGDIDSHIHNRCSALKEPGLPRMTEVISSGMRIVDSNSGRRCSVVTWLGLIVIMATPALTAGPVAPSRSGSNTAMGMSQRSFILFLSLMASRPLVFASRTAVEPPQHKQ
jgi:hypothetical protein